MHRPPRIGAGSLRMEIMPRLTTRADPPLRVPRSPLRRARPAMRTLMQCRPVRMERRTRKTTRIQKRIDLFKIWQRLLKSKDDKIKQRAVEKLTEMRYKGAAGLDEEPQRIIIDMPRPDRD